MTEKTRWIIWAILGGTLLLIGLVVSVYSHRLTTKIKSLTDVAERISIGDLGIEIQTKARDEIGELAEAISRMQESIQNAGEHSPVDRTVAPTQIIAIVCALQGGCAPAHRFV